MAAFQLHKSGYLPSSQAPLATSQLSPSGCRNLTDNAFFIRKSGALFYGCHAECCSGRLKKVHQFSSRFERYDDYKKLLELPKDELNLGIIEEYIRSVASFIDLPQNGFFVTSRDSYVKHLPIKSKEIIRCPSLFSKHNDIQVMVNGEKLKFSTVLKDLVATRNIPVYENTVWIPQTKSSKYQPENNVKNKFNTFSGFALDSEIKTSIDFQKTKLFELIERLVNYNKECLEFLLSWVALRVQKPFFKAPLILLWCNSKKGTGKGSFKLFLQKLFSCNSQVMVSMNRMSQFVSQFNSELETCLFLVLEEVTSNKKNSLREFSGLLKDVSSMTELLVEKKGIDRKVVPFYGNVLVFSNELFVVQVTSDNRRVVCFQASEKCNDKPFFDEVYRELDSLEVMKGAWDFFLKRDISHWDYTKIPETDLMKTLQRCSENVNLKFARWFFKLRGTDDLLISETELYSYWSDFCLETGIPNKRDCMFLMSALQSVLPCTKNNDKYFFASGEIQKAIRF